MRARALIFPSLLIAAMGCGDGVGHPIVSGAPVTQGAAGSGGSMSGGGGTAGLAAGTPGIPSAAPGLGGMSSVMPGTGGAAGRRVDFMPPWDGEPGGRGGPEWPDDMDMHPVPDGELCGPAAEWDDGADSGERELLEHLNIARDYGIECDGETSMPAPRLTMRPELRCAARLHSRDMSYGDFCGHVNLEGVGPEERMSAAGYMFGVAGESITCDDERVGWPPTEVLSRLIETGGSDCKNLGDPRFDAVGIGRFDGLWTLDFAGP